MNSKAAKTLKVAVIQMECKLGAVEENLAKASRFADEAATEGAALVLFPELMPGGYCLTEEIWETAEPMHGPSISWMRAKSEEHGIYIGTCFFEVDQDDFHITFVLTNPAGEIAGRVRKNPPASFEAYFAKAGADKHYIDTEIGRIGVAICYENALYDYYSQMFDNGIDLWLKPFSGGSFEAKFPIRQKDVDLINDGLKNGTTEVAQAMGIPVLMANKVGRLITEVPGRLPAQDIEFPGLSAIADSDGSLLAQLGSGKEGVLVEIVTLDPDRKVREKVPRTYGKWAGKFPWWAFIWPLTQKQGERSYRKNSARVRKAREMVDRFTSC